MQLEPVARNPFNSVYKCIFLNLGGSCNWALLIRSRLKMQLMCFMK